MTPIVYDDPDWLALVAGIIAHPEADLPRLVAADWLADRGEGDRAEFIRVQCELAEMDADGVGKGKSLFARQYRVLKRRESVLLASNTRDWFPQLSVTCNPAYHADQNSFGNGPEVWGLVRRGFVAEVGCPLAWWVGGACPQPGGGSLCDGGLLACPYCSGTGRTPGHGPALVRRHPIERVTVTDREPWPRANGGYWWTTDDGARSDLPSAVVIEMSRRAGQPVWDRGRLAFRTGKAAALALSGSLIAGAKGGAP